MKKSKSMQKKLTLYVSVVLLISNLILIALLNYALSLVLKDIVVPFEGLEIEINNLDTFSADLKFYGYLFAGITTLFGTLLTYILLGKYLEPLQSLSHYMNSVDRQNLNDPVKLSSNTTEISNLIDSFNTLLQKLRKAFDTQKDLSTYIAHQLKTPLAVLQTRIEVFRKKSYSEEEVEKLLIMLTDQVTSMNNSIVKILELSHIDGIELRESVPIHLLLEDLVLDLEDYAFQNSIRIDYTNSLTENTMEDSVAANFIILGNYTLLYQAFYNIIENAIKYNEPKGIVTISIQREMSNLLVKVSDTGVGIKENAKISIFQPFYRGESSDIQNKEGMGMGLAFSKKVFEHHKAYIEALDNDPKGTTFKITFNQ